MCMCVYLCGVYHLCADTREGHKRLLNSQEFKLQEVTASYLSPFFPSVLGLNQSFAHVGKHSTGEVYLSP